MLAALGGLGHADCTYRCRHERSSDDNEHECECLEHHSEGAGGHWIAEHEDPAGDAGDVGGCSRHRDHGDCLAVLQPAGGRVEGDH